MDGKTIFITGGNENIGLATARLFARQGVNVAIMARRQDANLQAKAIIEQDGGRCITFTGDVSSEDDVKAAIAETVHRFGRLDFAFNNAGIESPPKPLTEQTEEEYRRVFDVNVKGTWLCLKHQIPHMLRGGGGSIVINSSASGHTGTLMMPLYSASKHALLGLTKSVAIEYARQNIRINAVCPGAVRTGAYDRFVTENQSMQAAIEGRHPMGRVATPEEVAAAVLYLCRDGTFTTGSSLMVDGGYTAA